MLFRSHLSVELTKVLAVRYNPHNFLSPAPIHDPYDFNRDGRVNSTDSTLVKYNPTNFTNALKLITLTAPLPAPTAWAAARPQDLVYERFGEDDATSWRLYEAWDDLERSKPPAKKPASAAAIDLLMMDLP